MSCVRKGEEKRTVWAQSQTRVARRPLNGLVEVLSYFISITHPTSTYTAIPMGSSMHAASGYNINHRSMYNLKKNRPVFIPVKAVTVADPPTTSTFSSLATLSLSRFTYAVRTHRRQDYRRNRKRWKVDEVPFQIEPVRSIRITRNERPE